MHALPSMNSLF